MRTTRIKKGFYLLIIVILLLLTGYFRDFVFKSINAYLRAWDLNQDYFLPSFLTFLYDYEYTTVLNFKWLLTIIACLVYMGIALVAIRILFEDKKYLKITIFSYLALILFSGIFIGIGYVFAASSEKMYEFARYFMGMAQSPVVLMLLIPAFKLSDKEKKKISDS